MSNTGITHISRMNERQLIAGGPKGGRIPAKAFPFEEASMLSAVEYIDSYKPFGISLEEVARAGWARVNKEPTSPSAPPERPNDLQAMVGRLKYDTGSGLGGRSHDRKGTTVGSPHRDALEAAGLFNGTGDEFKPEDEPRDGYLLAFAKELARRAAGVPERGITAVDAPPWVYELCAAFDVGVGTLAERHGVAV